MKEQKAKPKKVIRKVKKSGLVNLKPRIMSARPKDRSLIAEHIAEATSKGKTSYVCLPIRMYIAIRDKIRMWLKQ